MKEIRPRAYAIAAALFLTGGCALIFQTVWMREFRMFFGGSTSATAAVLAVFMAGLGAGSLVLGRSADRSARPLRFYAVLELLISIWVALTPLLLSAASWTYGMTGGSDGAGFLPALLLRMLLAAMVVGVPAFLMGGTLPAAACAAESEGDTSRASLALLYGANTLGAVTGVGVATFWLIEHTGQRGALWQACALNALVALAVLLRSRKGGEAAVTDDEPFSQAPKDKAPVPLILAAAAVSGFVFFLMELVWYRMLGPLLGGTTFTFGLILGTALAGVGAGGLCYAAVRGRISASLRLLGVTCTLEAVCIVLPLVPGDGIALLAFLLRPLGGFGFGGFAAGWLLITALMVFPAALLAGFQFPLLIALLGRGRRDVGRHTGMAYAFNTAGAIAGSVAGGFGLLPLLTAPGAWKLAAWLMIALGVAVWLLPFVTFGRRCGVATPVLAALAAAIILFSPGPTAGWRHTGIGAGRAFIPLPAQPNDLQSWLHEARHSLIWEADGVESSVGIINKASAAFAVNGKVDGNARSDAGTTVMSGMLGEILARNPSSALVIGLGSGSTAGWLGASPSIAKVDVVELEPAVKEMARLCAPVNRDMLNNPKVRIVTGDGREFLMSCRSAYDIIVSEPSNPYRAGIASLFTREFYRAAAKRLNPGGVFIQWVQAYEIDSRTFQLVLATMHSAFPEIEIWQTGNNDLLLVGSEKLIVYDIAEVRRKIAQEPLKSALLNAWRVTDVEGVFAYRVAGGNLSRLLAAQNAGAVNTDDRNLLEYSFARSLGRTDPAEFGIHHLLQAASAAGDDRPMVVGGELDATKVAERRIGMLGAWTEFSLLKEGLNEEQKNFLGSMEKFNAGLPAEALRLWKLARREPGSPAELSAVAELYAGAGEAGGEPYIEALRAMFPAEACLIEARLRLRQSRVVEAVAALAAGLKACREDPWVKPDVLFRSLGLLEEIALTTNPETYAARLHELVDKPFSVFMQNDRRQRTLFRVSQVMDQKQSRGETLAALLELEPNTPWDRDLLAMRERCYRLAGHPLAAKAREDLESYYRATPLGVPPPTQQASTTSSPPTK